MSLLFACKNFFLFFGVCFVDGIRGCHLETIVNLVIFPICLCFILISAVIYLFNSVYMGEHQKDLN